MNRYIIVKEPDLLNRYFIETEQEYQNGTIIYSSNMSFFKAYITTLLLNLNKGSIQ